MTDDIHALSGAYAVDALDDSERADFEEHLAACAACRREVDSLREAAALLAETTAGAPSPQLRQRVLAEIALVRPLPPVVDASGTPYVGAHRAHDDTPGTPDTGATVTELAPRRRRRAATLLAAAAAVVAIGAGGVVWDRVGHDSTQPTNAAEAVMTAPDHQTYAQTLAQGVTATVYRSDKLNEAVLVTHGFPLAGSGKEYVLWLLHDGTAVPAGVLPRAADNEIVLSGDPATATAAGITVEPAGTNPTTPSGPMVASIPLQET